VETKFSRPINSLLRMLFFYKCWVYKLVS